MDELSGESTRENRGPYQAKPLPEMALSVSGSSIAGSFFRLRHPDGRSVLATRPSENRVRLDDAGARYRGRWEHTGQAKAALVQRAGHFQVVALSFVDSDQ